MSNTMNGMDAPIRPKIHSVNGDIIKIGTDAIVNAANKKLHAGGGVCGAIFAAAGHRLLRDECDKHKNCPTGSAVLTPSFNLATVGTKHIIHAVGPVFDKKKAEKCDELLVSAYRASLRLAESVDARSIAIPAISTGIYRFPPERAAPLVASLLFHEKFDLDEIVLMASDPEKTQLYTDALVATGL